MKSSRLSAVLWTFLFVAVLATNAIWAFLDDVPPVWDMAHHQKQGLATLDSLRNGTIIEDFPGLSDYYPPLYYLQEAVVYGVLGDTGFIAFWANLPGLFLLGFCTWRLALRCMDPLPAAVAGALPLLLPMVAWTSRETLLDVALAGWVTAAVMAAVGSEGLTRRRWVVVLAAVSAAGMLTKWTFVLFAAPPVASAFFSSSDRPRALLNSALGGLAALPMVLWWYIPNIESLTARFLSTAEAAVWENDPTFLDLAGWIYYPRVLSSYYLYLPLTFLLIWGLVRTFRTTRSGRQSDTVRLVVVWLTGGVVLATLLDAKDPRYIMPMVSPLAILLLYVWQERPRMVTAIGAIAAIQFLTVSFALPVGPVKIALFEWEPPSDYRTLSSEWVLYQSQYFDVAGPPRREDWKLREIVKALPGDSTVGWLPELPRFQTIGVSLIATHEGRAVRLRRLGNEEPSGAALDSVSHVVGKTGPQGLEVLTQFNGPVYRILDGEEWEVVSEWPLPDGSRAKLWRKVGGE